LKSRCSKRSREACFSSKQVSNTGLRNQKVAAVVEQTNSRGLSNSQEARLCFTNGHPYRKTRVAKNLTVEPDVSGKNIESMLSVPFRLIAEREKDEDGRPYRDLSNLEEIIKQLLTYFENKQIRKLAAFRYSMLLTRLEKVGRFGVRAESEYWYAATVM